MSWRSRPPSQYEGLKSAGGHIPLWVLLLVAVLCLALGGAAGLTLPQEEPLADPNARKSERKRDKLIDEAHDELTGATQLDAATGVAGMPSRFDLVVLGKEEQDVCVTAWDGWKAHNWYESACGVEVTWYLAARRGTPKMVEAAAKARFKARKIPTVGSFAQDEESGPLPDKLSGEVVAARMGTQALVDIKDDAQLQFPEMQDVYHDRVTTFDLATAYREHGGKRKVVARMSLLAQYTWT
ncbi:MAG: hypothetical protein GEV07_19980 [Streptosporangiales bacterium]|nr:hypothetical protein [Streptosporangiales bacterium]